MEIKPIKSEADYEVTLKEIELLFDSAPDTPEGDRLEVLTTLVEAYEERRFAIPSLIRSRQLCTTWKAGG